VHVSGRYDANLLACASQGEGDVQQPPFGGLAQGMKARLTGTVLRILEFKVCTITQPGSEFRACQLTSRHAPRLSCRRRRARAHPRADEGGEQTDPH